MAGILFLWLTSLFTSETKPNKVKSSTETDAKPDYYVSHDDILTVYERSSHLIYNHHKTYLKRISSIFPRKKEVIAEITKALKTLYAQHGNMAPGRFFSIAFKEQNYGLPAVQSRRILANGPSVD